MRFNPLLHGGYYMYHQINIKQISVLTTERISLFYVGLRKNSFHFPIQHYLIDFIQRFNPLKPSVHYMYGQYNIQTFNVRPTQ